MLIGAITPRTKTMMKPPLLIVWLFLLTVIPLPVALGYESSTDFSGGHLKGRVILTGPPPPPKRSNLVLNPDPYFCGRISDGRGWRLSRITSVGPLHSLKGAIVYLKEIKKGKPFSVMPRLLKLQNCAFLPSSSGMQRGEPLHIENWDPVQHQLEFFLTSNEGGIRLFGADLPPHPDNRKSDYLWEGKTGTPRPGPEKMFTVDQPGILYFRCNYHNYMEGWRIAFTHPYYSMTQESGEFTIADIPPGPYILMVWHPQGTVETPVHILARKTVSLDIQISLSVSTNEEEKPSTPHSFAIDLVGDQHIVPSVELQTWDPSWSKAP